MPKTIFTGENRVVAGTIRAAREEAGLTQSELAAKLHRDQSHISLIEGSQRRIDLVEFHALARALGLNPIDLFSRISGQLG